MVQRIFEVLVESPVTLALQNCVSGIVLMQEIITESITLLLGSLLFVCCLAYGVFFISGLWMTAGLFGLKPPWEGGDEGQ